jgi:hypothetical protein
MPSSTYKDEEETLKAKQISYPPNPKPSFNPKRDQKQTTNPSNPKPSFNPKREVRKETSKPREKALICMFCGCASHLNDFCFHRKRIEKRRFDYARNSS